MDPSRSQGSLLLDISSFTLATLKTRDRINKHGDLASLQPLLWHLWGVSLGLSRVMVSYVSAHGAWTEIPDV